MNATATDKKTFKHSEDTIDVRDIHLITYSKEKKRFVVEVSDLRANGIEPISHHFVMGGYKWVIYLWSEKYKIHICYVYSKTIRDSDGGVVAEIFKPYFGMVTSHNETLARMASEGTELHIIND